MKSLKWPASGTERRATVLSAIILLQAVCAVFFIGDAVTDMMGGEKFIGLHLSFESLAAIGLVAGVAFLMVELKRLLSQMEAMDTGLHVARGEIHTVMVKLFDAWSLTNAERDVAIMILKGLDNETIAKLRETAPGTTRAQATRVYAKSNTHGRAQFVSLFIEELMSGEFKAAI